jgi:hypothetical protein
VTPPYPAIKLDVPILPNQGLAGLKLRTKLIDIQDLFIGLGITKAGSFNLVAPFDARYHLGNGEVTVAVDVRNGKIFMLSACRGYSGALFGQIFVGMKVSDAIAIEPRLYYDEAEGMILCKGVQGVSIEIPKIDPPPELVPEMTISAINVYAEETFTLEGQSGRW